MIGDQADMLGRMRAVLPARWFPDTTPVLNAVLSGIASVWASAYALQFVRAQTRIATASGPFLDMVALDFFGAALTRRCGQDDNSLRQAIGRELLRERATRPALQSALEDLTGRTPVIFEPSRPADTRAWGAACGWGVSGGWGSLAMPFQCLVVAYRPAAGAVSSVVGYYAGQGWAGGGYGVGAAEYMSGNSIGSVVTDADIYAAIARTMPAGTIAWVNIGADLAETPAPAGPGVFGAFIFGTSTVG